MGQFSKAATRVKPPWEDSLVTPLQQRCLFLNCCSPLPCWITSRNRKWTAGPLLLWSNGDGWAHRQSHLQLFWLLQPCLFFSCSFPLPCWSTDMGGDWTTSLSHSESPKMDRPVNKGTYSSSTPGLFILLTMQSQEALVSSSTDMCRSPPPNLLWLQESLPKQQIILSIIRWSSSLSTSHIFDRYSSTQLLAPLPLCLSMKDAKCNLWGKDGKEKSNATNAGSSSIPFPSSPKGRGHTTDHSLEKLSHSTMVRACALSSNVVILPSSG